MAKTSAFVLTSLLLMIFASHYYVPLPEGVEEAWKYRLHGILLDAMVVTSSVVNKLTGWQCEAVFRKFSSFFFSKDHPNYPELEVKDIQLEGVPVRIYKHKSLKDPAPCVIYLHGGGWVIFDIDTFDSATTKFALETGIIVVSVDYRLAPENPYPAPLDDCLKATKYILQNGQQHGIDVHRVAISGDSAGGNLAAAVSLRLTEENPKLVPPLKLQVLLYPITQIVNLRTSSYRLYANYPVLNQAKMSWYIACYLGLGDNSAESLEAFVKNHHVKPEIRRAMYKKYFKEDHLGDFVLQNLEKDPVDSFDDNVNEEIAQKIQSLVVDPYISPLLAENSSLSKLPPAYVFVPEFDVLRDDGLLYVQRLKQAGVKVELSFVKGRTHGCLAPIPLIFSFKDVMEEWFKIYKYVKENL